MNAAVSVLLKVIRIAIGAEKDVSVPIAVDWHEVFVLSKQQGVCALCADVIVKMGESWGVEENLRYEWMGQAMVSELYYEKQKNVIEALALMFADEGLRMFLMKGYAASLMYEKPNRRSAGDIDFYLFGEGEKGDAVLISKGIKVKQNEDKHSVATYEGVHLENHASFLNVQEHPSLNLLESILESECENASAVEVGKSSILVPTVLHNALFLSSHIAGHFVFEGASLKQLVDWAVFLKNNDTAIQWDKVFALVDDAGYGTFLRCLNGIAKSYLGVNVSELSEKDQDVGLVDKVLSEIIYPKFSEKGNAVYKLRRYMCGGWKYRLVYRESMLATFFRRGWNLFRERYLPYSKSVWK